jgi:hypothetical protein
MRTISAGDILVSKDAQNDSLIVYMVLDLEDHRVPSGVTGSTVVGMVRVMAFIYADGSLRRTLVDVYIKESDAGRMQNRGQLLDLVEDGVEFAKAGEDDE